MGPGPSQMRQAASASFACSPPYCFWSSALCYRLCCHVACWYLSKTRSYGTVTRRYIQDSLSPLHTMHGACCMPSEVEYNHKRFPALLVALFLCLSHSYMLMATPAAW